MYVGDVIFDVGVGVTVFWVCGRCFGCKCKGREGQEYA